MNTVLADESPRVRSPWKRYVKTGLYLAVVKWIQQAERKSRPLIPVDAPIGYLPGDDLTLDVSDRNLLLAASCAPSVSIAGPRAVAIGVEGNRINLTATGSP